MNLIIKLDNLSTKSNWLLLLGRDGYLVMVYHLMSFFNFHLRNQDYRLNPFIIYV